MDALHHFFAFAGLAWCARGAWRFVRAVQVEIRDRRIARHGQRPGANSREPVTEHVLAVLHRDGRSREIH